MSWIDDWANAVLNLTIRPITETLGDIISPVWMVKIRAEPELQRERILALKDSEMYPPDPSKYMQLLASRPELRGAIESLLKIMGFQDSARHVGFEAARYKMRVPEAAALWQRGIVTDDGLYDHLWEIGLQNEISMPTGAPDRYGAPTWESVHRPDMHNFIKLLWRFPAIADVVHMEMRDAFPMSVERVREMTGDIPEVEEWAATQPAAYAVDSWTVGGGVDLLDALKEESTFGPQSFASWYIGARKWYTTVFQKIAQSLGIDPYFAMKHWEAHWRIPSWRMGRRLLWRTKYVSENMWAQLLKWNDYPPNLIEPMVTASYRALTRVDTARMHLLGVMKVPDIFVSYLDFGYHRDNAARMTAFVVIDNMESIWRDVINETLKAVSEGTISTDAAADEIWSVVQEPVPETLDPVILDRLNEVEIEKVWSTYADIHKQMVQWIFQAVTIAARKGGIARHRKRLNVAKRNYTGWVWTRDETGSRLLSLGLNADAITALLADWEPEREAKERLPSQSMLEDLLRRHELSVTEFRTMLHDKKYSPSTIDLILARQEKLPTRSMLEDFWLDKRIDSAEFVERMQQLGYLAETAANALSVLKRLPSQSMLEDFLTAGRISSNEFLDGLTRLGFTQKDAEHILATVARPPTQAMLQAAWIADNIDDAEFIAGMMRLGFSRDAATHALTALETPPTQSMLSAFWNEDLFTDAQFIDGMIDLGFSRETADNALAVLKKRV